MYKERLFSKNEISFLAAMGLVLGLRELSMTMLNPFISIYGGTLRHSSYFLCGLALGIYGLTNAFFQIPYGSWSDRIGRKPVILVGLAQLIIGLIIAFTTTNMYIFIFARALQGSGAVMAIGYSWIGDKIEDSKKNQAMGISGVIVALGAVIAFALGPVLYKFMSVRIMFIGCAFLILIAWLFIAFFIKEDKIERTNNCGDLSTLFKDSIIIKLSLLGFVINYVMQYMFFIVPKSLQRLIGASNMWIIFLPAVLIGILAMSVVTRLADRGYFIFTSIGAFIFLLLGTILIITNSIFIIFIGVILIMAGFMCLTSTIPSTINKLIGKEQRGSANGIYQTLTFLGFFFGPTLTGLFMSRRLASIMHVTPMIITGMAIAILFSSKQLASKA